MRRLITYNDNSYMPIWQTDLKFIQDNLIQAIAEMGKIFAFGRDMFIVAGCVLTEAGNQYHLSQGLVMISGELLFVPEQSVSSIGVYNPYLSREDYFDPLGEKQFLIYNSITEFRNTYDANYCKLSTQDDPEQVPGRFYLNTAKTITELIIEKAGEQLLTDTGWLDITLINGNTAGADKPQYRRLNDQVFLRGSFDQVYSGDFANIGASNTPSVAYCYYGNALGTIVTLNTAGDLSFSALNNQSQTLDGISWLI